MPTQETWLDDNIVQTTWVAPLTAHDLERCFGSLAKEIDGHDETVHILFAIEQAGHIPSEAPVLALRSGFLKKTNAGKVAVVGMDAIPQILAKVAVAVSRKDITFFPFLDSALDYLRN